MKPIRILVRRAGEYRPSLAWNMAFSHSPADGSFAALLGLFSSERAGFGRWRRLLAGILRLSEVVRVLGFFTFSE